MNGFYSAPRYSEAIAVKNTIKFVNHIALATGIWLKLPVPGMHREKVYPFHIFIHFVAGEAVVSLTL